MANRSIVVVDDDSTSLALLAEMLREEGYEVRPANSARLALASIAAWPPQLILSDIRMPEIDGFELCRRLKAEEKTRDIPLIFISSAGQEQDHVEGLAVGAVDFVDKPVRREELKARIRTHLELAELRHRLEEKVAQRTAELRESEERFRNMADTAPVMIWSSGPDKLCDFFNKRWLDFTGRTMEQELGNGWSEGVHPDDLNRCLEIYTSCFDALQWFQMEYRLRRADGEYRWLVDTGVPRIAPGGIFAGYIGSAIDITDIKRTQEEAFDKEKFKSLRLLTSGIAHDFRNLLAGIIVNAENAEAELPEGTSAAEDVQRIRATAVRATEIVRQLTIYSGWERGELALMDVSEITGEMLELTRTMISKHAELRAELGPSLPPVWGDAAQVRQIVMNLVINASDALGDRPGSIFVRTSRDGTFEGASVRLEVIDTGRGMNEEEKGRVFDPFFTTKANGRGLGLAVVRGVVQSHGGKIDVISSPGKGATFTVVLPCVKGGVAKVSSEGSRGAA